MNEDVKALLKAGMWDSAACVGNEPNMVPVAFKDVTDNDKLIIGNV